MITHVSRLLVPTVAAAALLVASTAAASTCGVVPLVAGGDVPDPVAAELTGAVADSLRGGMLCDVVEELAVGEVAHDATEAEAATFAAANGFELLIFGTVATTGDPDVYWTELMVFDGPTGAFEAPVAGEVATATARGDLAPMVTELMLGPAPVELVPEIVEMAVEEECEDMAGGEIMPSRDMDSSRREGKKNVMGRSLSVAAGAVAPSPAEMSPYDDPSLNYWPGHNTEGYDHLTDNPFLGVGHNPLSTFSIDVDTASYANVRRFLDQGSLPPADAVRIEELINYFNYDYDAPTGDDPFATHMEIAGCPWAPDHRLARIGLKGMQISEEDRPPSNLVFLLDVSGSMSSYNKLPLLKEAMKLLTNQLGEKDHIAIVVYAGAAGMVLPSTACDDDQAILEALDRLQAGGSTAGGAGIQLAYETATAHFIEGGINRVILATDGDFNVGTSDRGSLVRMIEDKAKSGVFLTVLGFGMGNIKDATLEQLADKGNGNYAYIDSIDEARKVLVEEMGGTLVTIAKDVKIQVEFNPDQVAAYRLIGYENRLLAAEDFNDDTKDAGEIGAGHTVTALYEIVPVGVDIDLPGVDELKYQRPSDPVRGPSSDELLTLKLRYKQPDGDTSKLLVFPITDDGASYVAASGDFKFAAAVAAYGMLLRDSPHRGSSTFPGVIELAGEGLGEDRHGYRAQFIELARRAAQLEAAAQ